MKTKTVSVDALRKGDLLVHEGYAVQIIAGPRPGKDLFDQSMIVFSGRIVAGPDRIGDEGDLTFGPTGVARRIIEM